MRIMPPITPPTVPPTITPTLFEGGDLEVGVGVVELGINVDTVTTELVVESVGGGVLGAAVANAPDPWSATEMVGWEICVIRCVREGCSLTEGVPETAFAADLNSWNIESLGGFITLKIDRMIRRGEIFERAVKLFTQPFQQRNETVVLIFDKSTIWL